MGRYNCLFNLGAVYRRLGNLEKSSSCLKEAFIENTYSPAIYNSYGMTLFEMGEYETAVINFDKAIQISADQNKLR